MPTDKQLINSWKAGVVLGTDSYCDDYSREPLSERNYSPEKSILNEDNSKTIGCQVFNHKSMSYKCFIYKSRGKK